MFRTSLAGAVAAASLLGFAAPALAEDTSAAANPAQTEAPAPAAGAQAQASTSFTDEQLTHFAQASVEIQQIQEATQATGPTDASREQMRAALVRHELDPATYNSIVAAIQADPALNQRVAELRASASGSAESTTTTN